MSLHEDQRRTRPPITDDRVAAAVAAREKASALAERRRRIGVINRRLGWIVLPMIIVASAIHWGPGGYEGWRNSTVIALQLVYAPLTLVHAGLSVYVFGLVPWSGTLRVFHIWFGYAYLGFMLASQTTFALRPVHVFLTAAMFISLSIHVGIGIYFARRRREATVSPYDFT